MNSNLTEVTDDEYIARLLFHPQMISNGVLRPSAFPTDELLARKGKTGCSVDRCKFLNDCDALLRKKAMELANPAVERAPFGFCVAQVREVRALKGCENTTQIFDVWPDKIVDKDFPKPWHEAHALIKAIDKSYNKSKLRGSRDRLAKLFSIHIVEFDRDAGIDSRIGFFRNLAAWIRRYLGG